MHRLLWCDWHELIIGLTELTHRNTNTPSRQWAPFKPTDPSFTDVSLAWAQFLKCVKVQVGGEVLHVLEWFAEFKRHIKVCKENSVVLVKSRSAAWRSRLFYQLCLTFVYCLFGLQKATLDSSLLVFSCSRLHAVLFNSKKKRNSRNTC